MLVIRLTRIGKKNQPSYRVVLTEKQNPVKGKFIEILGDYNPRLKTKSLKGERIKYWFSKGAKASATVHNLLVSQGVIEGRKVKAWRPKKKVGDAAAEVKPAVEKASEKTEEVESQIQASAEPETFIEQKPTEEPVLLEGEKIKEEGRTD